MAFAVKKTIDTEANILAIGGAGTACPGGVYLSSDTNKLWLGAADGALIGPYVTEADAGPQYYGDYPSNTVAGQNNVPLGGVYFLTFNNDYGMPEGMPKKRTLEP